MTASAYVVIMVNMVKSLAFMIILIKIWMKIVILMILILMINFNNDCYENLSFRGGNVVVVVTGAVVGPSTFQIISIVCTIILIIGPQKFFW